MVVKADVQGSVEAVVGELGKIQPPGGARQRDPHGHRRDHRERRHARLRVERDRRRLQRAAERRGARARRARGRRHPHLPRHLPAHRGHRAGARRHALAGARSRRRSARPRCARSSAPRGSASSPAATSRAASIRRNAQVRVVRDGTVVYETTIASLKRFKDDVREVQQGFECGILLEGFNDVKEGDVLEVYETREIERTDLAAPAHGRARARARRRGRARADDAE